jgi:hypothetical protein
MTSIPCHRSRHDKYLHANGCCFNQWDAAITSTIYPSVATSKVMEASFIHSQGCLSPNSSANIPGLTTSWCSILRIVRGDILVNYGGFPFLAAINWSHSSQHTLAVWYMVNWQPLTTVWIYSHLTAYCLLCVVLPVNWMIFQCAFWVIFLLAALAASRWTNWGLHSCCVLIGHVLD